MNFHLPPKLTGDMQLFTGAAESGGAQRWQTWSRPRGASMLMITAISGGGAGGAGFTGVAGSPRGGGGGGGSSGVFRAVVPLVLLPDTLFVTVGRGGNATNKPGGLSLVAIAPSVLSHDVIAFSNASSPQGGADGTAAAGGAGGAGGTAVSLTGLNSNLACLGEFISGAGQAGTAGGAQTGAAGTNVTLASSLTAPSLCNAGAGGAGTNVLNFTGGVYTAAVTSYTSEQRPTASGSSGHQLWQPFYSYGGCGGDSFDAAPGLPGGDGAFGAGGGGGGGGTTGGAGGDGGDGIVMFFWW